MKVSGNKIHDLFLRTSRKFVFSALYHRIPTRERILRNEFVVYWLFYS